jgi:mono/diheme cytochrome c family protein
MRFPGEIFVFASFVLCVAVLAACAEETVPEQPGPEGGAPAAIAPMEDAAVPRGPQFCDQARAESLPARLVAMGAGGDAGTPDASLALAAGPTWLVSDLFQQFDSICGRCHGSVQGLGGFQIRSQSDFATEMTATVLGHVMSDGPDPNNANSDPMPPFTEASGGPYSKRPDTDVVKQFAELVQQWLTLMKPTSFQYALPGTSVAGTQSTIPIPNASIGNPMTNIGNCIPSQALLYTDKTKMDALDVQFAAAKAQPVAPGLTPQQIIGLPLHLSETDLVTFDSATLAQYGVIAYAPGYPLWSDNAGKLRHIRVPRGSSVVFDKTTQSFTIPANTRFYKTFMKQVVDTDGSLRYRKIETRLILSRPDAVDSNGVHTPTALFGTYKWSDDESDAVLVQTPLNNGAPFADTLLQYNTNEPLAADILSGQPADPEYQLLAHGAARHYAIPSSQRCVQCHEGGESHSFVLGFLPLQINRRPLGQGGTIEATGPDELTQMQRFIDYGLVTGMDKPGDVLPLERAEGARTPRNDYELAAQGYMLGNCAHCHNPDGFPSRQNPVLVDILDFYPSASSGIFQFPLERYSPRIFRGSSGQTTIPYITPSLMDLPRTDAAGNPVPDPFAIGNSATLFGEWFAPWRSLIYRNVDDPFAYTDDLALFPHMPMNTPGYDPRAKQILSDWMVSIPAVRKNPGVPEYAFYAGTVGASASPLGAVVDVSPQPYVEVLAGDPRYNDALAAAKQRLAILHSGVNPAEPTPAAETGDAAVVTPSRYADLGQTDDILDPAVVADPACTPVPVPDPSITSTFTDFPIPGHCHWVITDTTQPPPPWAPRRPDWQTALAVTTTGATDAAAPAACNTSTVAQAAQEAAHQDQATAISFLQNIHLDDTGATSFLTTPRPFGLWQKQSGCNFSSVQPVSWYDGTNGAGSQRPLWMDQATGFSPSDPVYTQTPGQAVFKMICINCHGPLADSNGRLAQNLATMTGGLAQVADFRDGLFGPVGSAPDQTDIHLVFGSQSLPADAPAAWTSASEDDRAARYMAWMALGGTQVKIPPGVLQIVALTQVLDQHRQLFSTQLSANMLSTAKGLCQTLLGAQPVGDGQKVFVPTYPLRYSSTLIHTNGDAELWLRLCTLNNPPPVHVIGADGKVDEPFSLSGDFDQATTVLLANTPALQAALAHAPVGNFGNSRGMTDTGLRADNLWPWCESSPTTAQANNWPVCPPTSPGEFLTSDQEEQWAVRGAINAGLGVFLYVKSLESLSAPPPDYNQCAQLP